MNTTYAVNSAQKKIEEIRDHTFSDIYTYYITNNNDTFDVDGISAADSEGSIVIINDGSDANGLTSADLLQVTVTVCWRQKNGRIIGGDAALNPLSSSPVRLVTYIANK